MSKKQPEHLAKKGGSTKSTILIIAAAVVIVALVVVIVLLLTKKDAPEPTAEERRNVVVNEQNVNDVLDAMMEADPIEPGNYMVSMNTTWHFANGTAVSDNAFVENDSENTNDVYFDVTLDDTGELIYSSPVLPLGSYINSIALDKDLDAGTYPCIITYTLVDEEQNPVSSLRLALTVVVDS